MRPEGPFEPGTPRADDSDLIALGAFEDSAWARLRPPGAGEQEFHTRADDLVREPRTLAALAEADRAERYPIEVLDDLRAAGFTAFMEDSIREADAEGPRVSVIDFATLNVVLARADGALAITVGVNALAVLPAIVGASPEQFARMRARVGEGAFLSLLLTELRHGSNLARNAATAELGTLEGERFVPVSVGDTAATPTHARIRGTKDLINGTNHHELWLALIRIGEEEAGGDRGLGARAGHTVFFIDRGALSDEARARIEVFPAWRTLPARAADIGGVRFHDLVVPLSSAVGAVRAGFSIVRQALMISRGAIAALASGAATRARELAARYATRRDVWGSPIAGLEAIAEHLARVHALDRVVAAVALQASLASHALGIGAGYYTALAKLVGCSFAEEAVREGAHVLSARALVEDLPYARLRRDVSLYSVFDGTPHVMAEEISYRMAHMARPRNRAKGLVAETMLEQLRERMRPLPCRLRRVLSRRRRVEALDVAQRLRALAACAVDEEVGRLGEALAGVADRLLDAVGALDAAGRLFEEQALRFDGVRQLGNLEALTALMVLSPLGARAELIGPSSPVTSIEAAADRYAFASLGARTLVGVRGFVARALARGGLEGVALEADTELELEFAGSSERALAGFKAALTSGQETAAAGDASA
ncbi:MAG: acyl-CoA dehydrogenase family protein [Planctomycetota bacterium]